MRNYVLAAVLAMVSISANAGNDKAIGLNFLFTSKGFQGVQLQGSVGRYEAHGAVVKDNQFTAGLGYRVLDTEGNGTRNDDDLSASLSAGLGYVGGKNAGFRPYGQVNAEIDAGDNKNINLGAIDYGLGMTEYTNGYGYIGIEHEDLEDNERPKNNTESASREVDAPTDGDGDGDSDDGDTGDGDGNNGHGDNPGDDGDNPGNDDGDSGDGDSGGGNDNGGGDGDSGDGDSGDNGGGDDSDDNGGGGDCKPGFGFGDTNHCHSGPPGRNR